MSKGQKKVFKTLDEQVDYLQQEKLVQIQDSTWARKVLFDNNYYNLISCSKIKFAKGIEFGKHEYEKTDFNEWVDYFEKDCELSEHLRRNILNFERTINSRVAYHISELMETGVATECEQEMIKHLIQTSKNVDGIKFFSYEDKETWTYITKMMFGDMKKLVFWLLENKRSFYSKIIEGYPFLGITDAESKSRVRIVRSRLNEINNLRNKLFHFTPSNIYLVYGKNSCGQLNNVEKRKVVRWVYRLGGNQNGRPELDQICQYSRNFVKMKKRPTINVD